MIFNLNNKAYLKLIINFFIESIKEFDIEKKEEIKLSIKFYLTKFKKD